MFVLFLIVVGIAVGIIEALLGLGSVLGAYGPLSGLFMVATFVPSLAVTVRRLHDTDRSGWWMLVGIIPYAFLMAAIATGNLAMVGLVGTVALVGAIVLLVLTVLDGTKGPNRFGPDPKGAGADAAASPTSAG